MNTLPSGNRGSSQSSAPDQYDISNARPDNNTSISIQGDSNQNIGNVLDSYNNTVNNTINKTINNTIKNTIKNIIKVRVSEESLKIQAWLSSLEPHRRHQDISNRRLDGVGDWVLQRNEFKSWRRNQDGPASPTLLCYGGQGVGKTYIRYKSVLQKSQAMLTKFNNKTSSLVIDTLHDQACGQNIAVLSLYCDYQAQKDQSAINMIGSLLGQVVVGGARIPVEVKSAFDGSKKRGGQGLRLPSMLKLFTKTTNSFERVYICIDAVDELLSQNRSELLRALRQIIQDAPNTRLFLTGRPYIRAELDKYLTLGAYIIHIVTEKEDITRYLTQKMDEDDADPKLMTEDLKNDIIKTMLGKASEM